LLDSKLKTREARFVGAKRDYFLPQHGFALRGGLVIGLANFHWSCRAGKFPQQLPASREFSGIDFRPRVFADRLNDA
jgi:hypothetical protein